MVWLSRSSGTLYLGLLLACGCSPEPSECSYDVEARGSIQYFDYSEGLSEICPGSYEAAQAHLEWVWEQWSDEAGEPPRVGYGVYPSRDSACWPCADGAAACSAGDTLATVRVPHRHELSHVARGRQCGALLEEGWAKLYDDHFHDHGITGSVPEALAAVESTGSLPGTYYGLAGQFAAFLIETRGLDAFRLLCDEPTNSESEFGAAVEKILGADLESVLADFDAWPSDGVSADVGSYRQDLDCVAADGALSLPASWMVELDCADLDVEGSPSTSLTKVVSFEVVEAGSHVFELTAPEAIDAEVTIELRSCEREGLRSRYYLSGQVEITDSIPAAQRLPELLFAPDMPAGIYLARVRVAEAEGGASFGVGVSAELQSSWEP